MDDLSVEERDLIEVEVYKQIKSVRLVFELGFPTDLVAQATQPMCMNSGF